MHSNKFMAILTCIALAGCHFKNKHADLIIHNAVIYTMDESNAIHQAVAIENGKIVAIGAERDILNEYHCDESIDAAQRAIYPGFIDAHCHFLGYGRTLSEVSLDSTSSFNEMFQRLTNVKPNARGWIIGRGWDQNDWADQSFPSRQRIDSLFPDTPVSLKRIDGHAILVNGKALEIAGIRGPQEVSGGSIDFERGILVDNAMQLVEERIPASTESEDAEALLRAQRDCFSVGLTTIDDAGLMKSNIDLIKTMHADGRLKMRIYAMLADDRVNFEHYLKSGIDTSDLLNVRSFKFYADGALGSRGACLLAPYSDVLPNPSYGLMLQPQAYYEERARALYQKGFQMCTHAIGDSANRMMLQIYGRVLNGAPDARWRIEHAQVVHQADVPMFRQFNIIASIQPTHATSDAPWAIFRLGQQRMMRAYAYRTLKEQLGMVALGTDFPVEQISPLRTFYAATARKYAANGGVIHFQADEAITREEALRGMTIWAAIANFEEQKKGSLEVGKFADVVMLDHDILKCAEDEILRTNILMTVLGGEIVYRQ